LQRRTIAMETPESPVRSPARKKRYNFSKRKAKFARECQRTPPSPFDDVLGTKRQQYIPPSPVAAERRSLRRTKERPTCLVFGQLRETFYPDHFFVATANFTKIPFR
jgi:hypothetical protein